MKFALHTGNTFKVRFAEFVEINLKIKKEK